MVDDKNHFDHKHYVDIIRDDLGWNQVSFSKQWEHFNETDAFARLMLNIDVVL